MRPLPAPGRDAAAYLPRWSARILDEAQRAQQQALRPPWPLERSARWRQALETHFPEAMVAGFEPLEALLTNHPGDRHVLAAAIRGRAEVIVTFNLRHFRPADLAPWGVSACHPADYLVTLHGMDPGGVVGRLTDIARCRQTTPAEVLGRLARTLPAFATHVAEALGWELPAPPPPVHVPKPRRVREDYARALLGGTPGIYRDLPVRTFVPRGAAEPEPPPATPDPPPPRP